MCHVCDTEYTFSNFPALRSRLYHMQLKCQVSITVVKLGVHFPGFWKMTYCVLVL